MENYREEIKRAINASHNRLLSVINNHLTDTINPINVGDLDSFPVNVWVWIGDNIKAKKRKNRFKNYLNFSVEMDEGAAFAEHFHADAIESTEVLEGEFLDMTTGKLYKVGDVADYKEGKRHKPIATKKTELHVLFKKVE